MGAERKSRIQREATRLLRAGVAGQVFPGGSATIAYREGGSTIYVDAAAGKLSHGGDDVRPTTPYDLASLTKPFVATAAMRFIAKAKLALDTPAETILSGIRGGVASGATVEQLLSHRSGLAAWGGLYLDVPHDPGSGAARRWILAEAARRIEQPPGNRVIYSDLGYLLAGACLERIGGRTLAKIIADEVTEPLGISDVVYYAGTSQSDRRAMLSRKAAPTEICQWRGRLIQGEVHDENCAALGGVAGHAGLFGTARGVARLGREMLEVLARRSNYLPPDILEEALEERPGGTKRVGWDGRSEENSATGRYMGAKTFGHLGFTGTSIWCDPDSDVAIALLTNRVFPSRANEKIRGFRPAFHDGVMAALKKK